MCCYRVAKQGRVAVKQTAWLQRSWRRGPSRPLEPNSGRGRGSAAAGARRSSQKGPSTAAGCSTTTEAAPSRVTEVDLLVASEDAAAVAAAAAAAIAIAIAIAAPSLEWATGFEKPVILGASGRSWSVETWRRRRRRPRTAASDESQLHGDLPPPLLWRSRRRQRYFRFPRRPRGAPCSPLDKAAQAPHR